MIGRDRGLRRPAARGVSAALAAVSLLSCDPTATAVYDGFVGSISGTVTLQGVSLGGVVVDLTGPNNRTDTTTSAGAYAFEVADGSYTVTVAPPDSVLFAVAAIATAVGPSQATATIVFIGDHVRTSTVTGFVRADGVGVQGVSVRLTGGPDSVTESDVTAGDGAFSFTGLRRGSYSVAISGWDEQQFQFTVDSQQVSTSVGQAASVSFDGVVRARILTDTLRYGRVAVPYEDTLHASGGGGGYTWSILSPDGLPPGLTLEASTGVISGTPSQVAVDTLVVHVATSADGDTDTVRVRIGEEPVAVVEVSPALDTITIGEAVQLVAALRGPSGSDLTGRPVTWSSSAPSVAAVGATGLVDGFSPGVASIHAAAEGVTGQGTIHVLAAPGIRAVESNGGTVVSEGGSSDTVMVALWIQPAANVSVTVSSSDPSEASVSPTTLTFTTADWASSQPVIVTGVDDALDDGDQVSTLTFAVDAASSSDEYDAVAAITVSAAATDDDVAGISVLETNGDTRVDEAGMSDTLSVALTAQPTGNVVLNATGDDGSEATVAPATLTFTPADWATPRIVTITGVDDEVLDGDQTSTVTVSVDAGASSGDYDGVAGVTRSVVTADDPPVRIVSSFDVPGGSPTGIAWDGTDLWIADNTSKLYRFSTSGTLLETHNLAFSVSDLAWDGANVWAHLVDGSAIVKLDAQGSEIGRLEVGYWYGSGFAFDGAAFWVGDYNIGRIYKHLPDGTLQRYIETDFFGHPTGITWDGTDLLVGDSFELYNRVYRITTDGIEAGYIDIDALGLESVKTFEKKSVEWDGQHLWYSSDGRFKVYELAFERPVSTP